MISCGSPARRCPHARPSPTNALVSAASPGAATPSSLVTRTLTWTHPTGRRVARRCPSPDGRAPDHRDVTGTHRQPDGPSPCRGPGLSSFTRNDGPNPQDLGRLAHRPAVAHSGTGVRRSSSARSVPPCARTRWRTPRDRRVRPRRVVPTRAVDRCSPRGPNRLADGRYEFNGVRAQAALDEPERRNAIHGLVRWLPWTLQTRHQNQLSLRLQLHPSPGYPFSLLLEIEYHVGRDGLTVTTRAQSLDEGSIPFGLGFHPYLTAGPETVDGAILHLPAHHTLELDDRGLPHRRRSYPSRAPSATSRPRASWDPPCSTRPTPHSERDADGKARASLDAPGGAAGATLWVDPGFPYLMVYTGDTLPELSRAPAGGGHRADDLPPQRAAHGQGRHRPPARAGVGGPLGDRSPVTARATGGAPLDGHVVAVTGSSSGIGAATARAFAAVGASVLVNSARSVAEGEAVAASLPRRGVRAGRHHRSGVRRAARGRRAGTLGAPRHPREQCGDHRRDPAPRPGGGIRRRVAARSSRSMSSARGP